LNAQSEIQIFNFIFSGTAFITGTPANLVVLEAMTETFQADNPITFVYWVSFAGPLASEL
jgi:UDP-glucose 4-epimerase